MNNALPLKFSASSMDFLVHPREEFDPSWLNRFRSPYFYCELKKDEETIAQCEIHVNRFRWWCRESNTDYYYISDLSVRKKYRGNNYCSLLLLNVMYYFDQKRDGTDREIIFEISAYKDNIPAMRAYRKIFGRPCSRDRHLIHFSTKK